MSDDSNTNSFSSLEPWSPLNLNFLNLDQNSSEVSDPNLMETEQNEQPFDFFSSECFYEFNSQDSFFFNHNTSRELNTQSVTEHRHISPTEYLSPAAFERVEERNSIFRNSPGLPDLDFLDNPWVVQSNEEYPSLYEALNDGVNPSLNSWIPIEQDENSILFGGFNVWVTGTQSTLEIAAPNDLPGPSNRSTSEELYINTPPYYGLSEYTHPWTTAFEYSNSSVSANCENLHSTPHPDVTDTVAGVVSASNLETQSSHETGDVFDLESLNNTSSSVPSIAEIIREYCSEKEDKDLVPMDSSFYLTPSPSISESSDLTCRDDEPSDSNTHILDYETPAPYNNSIELGSTDLPDFSTFGPLGPQSPVLINPSTINAENSNSCHYLDM